MAGGQKGKLAAPELRLCAALPGGGAPSPESGAWKAGAVLCSLPGLERLSWLALPPLWLGCAPRAPQVGRDARADLPPSPRRAAFLALGALGLMLTRGFGWLGPSGLETIPGWDVPAAEEALGSSATAWFPGRI